MPQSAQLFAAKSRRLGEDTAGIPWCVRFHPVLHFYLVRLAKSARALDLGSWGSNGCHHLYHLPSGGPGVW